jgi:hypothetical protein
MHWRARVILRWWLLVQAFAALSVWLAWSTRPVLENLAILIGIPIASLWIPLLLAFVASSPRQPAGDDVIRPLLVGTLTLVLWSVQIVLIVLMLVTITSML